MRTISAFDVRDTYYLCQSLWALFNWENVAAPQAALRAAFGGFGRLTFYDRTATAPRFFTFEDQDRVLVGIDGASTVSLGEQYAFGGSGLLDAQTQTYGFNVGTANSGQEIYRQLYDALFERRKIMLCGYSFGATVANWMAARIRDLRILDVLSCTLIASPRAGTQAARDFTFGLPIVRWQYEADLITQLLPIEGTFPMLRGLSGPYVRRIWDTYVNIGACRVISRNAFLFEGFNNPVCPADADEMALVGFLTSSDSQAALNHKYSTYSRLLHEAAEFRGLFNVPRPPPVPNDPAADHPQPDPPIVPQEQPLNLMQGIVFPPAELGFPVGPAIQPFRSSRVEKVPCVLYGKVVIVVCKSASASRRLARILNASVNQCNQSRATNVTDLLNALNEEVMSFRRRLGDE